MVRILFSSYSRFMFYLKFNISTQWIGWLLSVIACFMWVWFGYRDKDYPRALMELMYLILSMRAMYNWLI